MTKKVFISFFSNFFAGSLLSLPLCNTENIITREQNKQLRSSFLLCLILSILLSLKKFLYCQFVLHIKHILSHVTPGMPPRKTDGFSWYVVRATRLERVNFKIYAWDRWYGSYSHLSAHGSYLLDLKFKTFQIYLCRTTCDHNPNLLFPK